MAQRTASLGWLQLRHRPLRLLVASAGIAFAVLLILMQLGFRSALFESAVRYHDRFQFDRRPGFCTRSLLAMPVRDRQGRAFGVAQPLNAADEERFARFAAPLGLILESWQRLDRWSRSRL